MKKLSITFIGLYLLIASCRKEDKTPPVNPLKDKMKTSKSVLGNGTVSNESTYLYDEKGRLIKIAAIVGDTYEYSYAPGKVFIKLTEPNGTIENRVWDISANGTIAHQTTSTLGLTYFLNQEGYIKKLLITKYNMNTNVWYETEMRDYYYSNTGLLDSIVFYVNSVKSGTSIYSDYTDKPDLFNEQTGRPFNPKQWKYFYNRVSLKNPQGNIYQVNTWEHEFDAKGRRVKLIVKLNGNLSVTHTYTYYD